MLGFGASGTALALRPPRNAAAAEQWFRRAAVVTSVALLASPILAGLVPLDASQLVWSPGQWARLGALYLVLAFPFGAGGLAVLLAITRDAARPGVIYGASFAGSGLGAAAAVAALWIFTPARAIAIPALFAAVGAVAAARPPRRRAGTALAGTALAIGAIAAVSYPPWRLDISPYKALPQAEAYPDATRIAERTSPLGWLVAVQAPAFRYAPGLSLAYRGPFPTQVGLFVDGDLVGAVSEWDEEHGGATLLDWLPAALPFALAQRDTVLVIGAGGWTEVWNAVAGGARAVTAVELSSQLAALAARGAPPEHGMAVEWVIGDARAVASRTPRRFDLVTIGPGGGGLGASAAGVYALDADFLHTVDAYERYLRLLRPGGVLAITRWMAVPPRQSVRVILSAADALRRVAAADVARGLTVTRSWATATVLVKPDGFTPDDLARLTTWADARQMDLDWQPGLHVPITRFHFLEAPVLFEAARAATAGPAAAREFADAYPFDVAPATDARPYPHHFLRPASLRTFLHAERGEWLPFTEWGYVALVATLVQATAVAAALLLLPTLAGTRGTGGARPPLVAYFGALGLGYLAGEIAAIQQFSLLLGHPVYAVAAALAAFLICSGAGSMWSDRRPPAGAALTGLTLPALLMVLAVIGLPLVHVALPAPISVRVLLAVLVLGPVATLMGVPFPAGLRQLAGPDAGRTAWAWATNGFASVVAAPLAALIALEAGSPWLFAVAAAAYAGAGLALRAGTRPSVARENVPGPIA